MGFVKKIATGLITVTLVACGSDDGDLASSALDNGVSDDQGVSATRDIAGLWDFTENKGDEGVDVIYVLIEGDGSGVIYDYQGDTFDQGENCYQFIDSPVVSLGNNQFESTFRPFAAFTATSENETLTITDIEGTITVNLVEGLSIIDFNACQ